MDHPRVLKGARKDEIHTPERCFITELWNDDADWEVSIAEARVEPGVVTQRHRLDVDERYLIIQGVGRVEIEGLSPQQVVAGDVVAIPARSAQRIENTGTNDLLFLCICTPRFEPAGYHAVVDS